MQVFKWKSQNCALIQQEMDLLQNQCSLISEVRSSSKEETLKLSKINFQILQQIVKQKSDGNFIFFFLKQYELDSKKKKREQLTFVTKLTKRFSASMVQLEAQKFPYRLGHAETKNLLLLKLSVESIQMF